MLTNTGAHLFVCTIVVRFLLIDGVRSGVLEEEVVESDTGIVRSEDFHTEAVHEVLEGIVQVCGVQSFKDLIFTALGCTAGATSVASIITQNSNKSLVPPSFHG